MEQYSEQERAELLRVGWGSPCRGVVSGIPIIAAWLRMLLRERRSLFQAVKGMDNFRG